MSDSSAGIFGGMAFLINIALVGRVGKLFFIKNKP